MPPPAVTIGIPCYNSEEWLRPCLESALAQSGVDAEIIVVDDGSTDRSVEIAREFGDAVRLIEAPHRGANHARNEILRAARGEWIQHLDADDFLLPDKITRQLREVRPADADIIYSPVWIEQNSERAASPLDTMLDLPAQWLSWQLPQTGGCLWRKSALQQLGGWNEAMPCCQEHELYLRAIRAGCRFVHARTPGAVYRIWSEGTLCRKDPRLVVSVKTRLIDDLRAWMIERGRWTWKHAHIAGQACFEMARTLARYDLAEAAAYHRERQERELIHLNGPAAPRAYAVAYRTLGFSAAERLAAAKR